MPYISPVVAYFASRLVVARLVRILSWSIMPFFRPAIKLTEYIRLSETNILFLFDSVKGRLLCSLFVVISLPSIVAVGTQLESTSVIDTIQPHYYFE